MTAAAPSLPRWAAALADRIGPAVLAAGEARPQGRHIAVRAGRSSTAVRDGERLELTVAPGDEVFAEALILAFAADGTRPAAADPATCALLATAVRVAARDVTVLIEGPTGTGKEGLARFLHHRSPRRDAPLVAVNCAALPEQMIESILFGHERGAFTGAAGAAPGLIRAADGGTLLLDEVAELPLGLQAKLLRTLQEREVLPLGATRPVPVDVRVIAAGNRDLKAEVAAGRFRADLYWRLAVFPLRTLPLVERPADIPAIVAAWLLAAVRDGLVPWPSAAALARLAAHAWPGNVRELGNVLDRALVLADGAALTPDHLLFDGPASTPRGEGLAVRLRSREQEMIAAAVAEAGSQVRAAARLGISERTLRYKLAAARRTAPTVGVGMQ